MSAPTAEQRAHVLLTSTNRTTFVDDDATTLLRHFDVDVLVGSGVRVALEVLRRARRADVSISWLASVYSVFMVAGARVGGRRSMIILGGVDVARDEELGYGIWRSRWRRPLLRWALRHASRILAVDVSLRRSLASSSGLTNLHIEVLPTGYDPSFWFPDAAARRGVLLVAGCRTRARALVKGVDLYVEAARVMPSVPFTLIGTDPQLVASFDPPSNLTVIGPLDRGDLRTHYRAASVFCLPSRHEGLPNALCEAMLCGCSPVGVDVGGVRDVIGDTGPVVASGDAGALHAAIERALSSADDVRAAARARIIECYPRVRREERLVAIVEELADA